MQDYKILIKFPTRGRPDKFFRVLDEYIAKAENLNRIAFLVSLDTDDVSMNNEIIVNRLKNYQNKIKLIYFFGNSKTKIEAVNADMDKVSGWDILLLASDDMIPVIEGYDRVICKDMNDYFKRLDGVLWYNDGGQNNINTLSIMGKKYYDMFGYIYHPDYVSLWCDNEFTEVSEKLKKVYKSDQIIIEHQHPVYQKTNYDQLYARNESYYNIDKQTYEKRRDRGFDLDKLNKKLFSILITSIPERLSGLAQIYKKLEDQIKKNQYEEKVEILSFVDNKTRSIGHKRQDLINASDAKFLAFLDDDDLVSDDYIKEIVSAIEECPEVDVISFNQEAKIGSDMPVVVYFGLQYENTEYIPGIPMYRKPFHMCAWNCRLAKQIEFKDISWAEDWHWIKELCNKAKTEKHIDKILHYYIFDKNTTTTNK
jgi:hypothetical protein